MDLKELKAMAGLKEDAPYFTSEKKEIKSRLQSCVDDLKKIDKDDDADNNPVIAKLKEAIALLK